MSRLSVTYSIVLMLILLITACSQESRESADQRKEQPDTLIIADAWARAAAEGTNSAAYLTIYNHTPRSDTLTDLSSEATSVAEVHESYEEDGMAGMRPADTLVIEPGDRLELKPGGYHVMLMQVKQKLLSGDSLQLSLEFTEAGTREVTTIVQ